MIKFAICEDEKSLAIEYKKQIDMFMMNFDDDYKCYHFNEYDENWKKFAEQDDGSFKIYLLDIRTEKGSGIDAARIIREEIDDWTSMIIMITAFNEYKYEVLSKRLMLVDFINKVDNCEKCLKEAFAICMKNYNKRPKILRYTYKGEAHSIFYKDITHIEKEPESKLCTIYKAKGEEVKFQGSINSLIEELDERFIKASRSTIINLEQVSKIDTHKNKIIFKNGKETINLSKDRRGEVTKYVSGSK